MWSVWLVFCDCDFHSIFPLTDKNKRLPDDRDWLWGKLGLVLMGKAKLSKSLIQFSVDGWDCVPSLLFDLKPNYGGGNEGSGDLLQKVLCRHSLHIVPPTLQPATVTHASARDSWALTSKLGSVFSGVTAPFFWVLVSTRFCLCPPRICFPSTV